MVAWPRSVSACLGALIGLGRLLQLLVVAWSLPFLDAPAVEGADPAAVGGCWTVPRSASCAEEFKGEGASCYGGLSESAPGFVYGWGRLRRGRSSARGGCSRRNLGSDPRVRHAKQPRMVDQPQTPGFRARSGAVAGRAGRSSSGSRRCGSSPHSVPRAAIPRGPRPPRGSRPSTAADWA